MDKTISLRLVAQTAEMKAAIAAAKAEITNLAAEAAKVGPVAAAGMGRAEGATRSLGVAASTGAASMQKLGAQSIAATTMAAAGNRQAAAAAEQHERSVRGASSAYNTLAGIVGTLGLVKIAGEVWEANRATAAWEGGLQAATGTAAAGAAQLEFLRSSADRLGLTVSQIAQPFVSLTAAAAGTSLAGTQLQDIFLGITEYGTALRVGNERIALSLNAVQQMISKGVVSSEELRQQLGESLPGAFRLAAESMNVTTADFNKMLAAGEVTAEELLPSLAKKLRELAASSLEVAASSPEAELNRTKTAIADLFVEMGKAGLNDAIADLFREITSALREFVDSGAANAMGNALTDILTNIDDLAVGIAVFIGTRGIAGFIASIASGTVALGSFTVGVRAATAGMIAFAASPAGIALAVAAIAVAVYKFGDSADDLTSRLGRNIDTLDQFQNKLEEISAKQFEAIALDFQAAANKLAAVNQQIDRLREGGAGDRAVNSVISQLRTEAQELEAQIAKLRPGLESLARSQADQMVGKLTKAWDALTPALKKGKEGQDDAADAIGRTTEFIYSQVEQIQLANAGAEEYAQHQDDMAEAADRMTDAIARSNKGLSDYLRNLRDETRLLELTGDAREEAARALEAEAVFQRRLNDLIAAGVPMTWALAQAQDAYNRALAGLEARDAAEEFDEIRQAVEGLGDSLFEAFGEVASGADSIEGALENLGRSSSRFWSNMISDSMKAGESLDQFLERASAAASLTKPDGSINPSGVANLIGSGYNLYQAYRQGDPLSGAASGASIGMAFGGPVGAIVGGIVGALAGILGGPKDPDLRLGATGRTRKPEQSFTTEFGTLQLGARGLEGGESEFIGLVQEFDEQLANIVGSFGDGTAQLEAVRSRLATWAVDLKGDAITAENVLGSRFSAILSTFSSDVQAFVGSAGKLEDRVQRLADAAFIEAAASAGTLLDSFGPLASMLEEHQGQNESIAQTYERLVQSTATLESALGLTGVSLDLSRAEFIEFAAGIAEAASGVQNAAQLWQSYFETFYDAEERATLAQNQALAARNTALAALGLEATISAASFREMFEAALPTLSPDEVVQWLRAGAAIGAYNATLAETPEAAEQANTALDGLNQTLDSFAAGIEDQFQTLARSGLSDFERQMLAIDDELQNNIAQLLNWRAQMVRAGASGNELARVDALLGRAHQLAAQQAVQAINALRDAGRSIVSQLYGGGSDASVTSAAQGMADAGVSAFQQIGEAAADTYQQQLSALQQIREYLDAQLLGDLSSLTPGQQFAEAQAQFAAALAAAQGGDATALGSITQIAQTLLSLGRDRFAGGAEFVSLEASVRAALQGLLGLQFGPGTGTPGPGGIGGTGFDPISQATTEFGAQATENRLELASQLAEIVRNLLEATGQSLAEVADSIGLNLNDLVADLGVNLDDLTAASTLSLAQIAASLGVELSELAANVGVDLGALGDQQSLLNDAVEMAINGLPEDQRDELKPLLDAVEVAAATGGPELVNQAIKDLEDATNRIGGGAATALAPFFAGINPINPLIAIDGILRAGFEGEYLILNAINESVRALVPITPIPINTNPSSANTPVKSLIVPFVGSPVQALASVGAQQGPSRTELAMLDELRAMRAEIAQLRQQNNAGHAKTAEETKNTARDMSRAYENASRDVARTAMRTY